MNHDPHHVRTAIVRALMSAPKADDDPNGLGTVEAGTSETAAVVTTNDGRVFSVRVIQIG